MVIPAALRILRIRPDRKFTVLGELAQSCGWKYRSIVRKLEAKRTRRAHAYNAEHKLKLRLRTQAAKDVASNKAVEKATAALKVLP